ncbi:hypothetical protein EF888_07290 [Silicimonas algicola]|nr:hypothetical protein [Silicimonas algicola]AZQ66956.1 hypothetical protein EF888_07290 [Silicimonas algicola]
MSTSIAEVFRTRQALRDLDEATRIHRDAVLRLGTTGAEREDIAAIVEDGGRILLPDRQRAYHQLLLSAALPEDDFPAFIAATAILLTDRISEGGGTDDLYWNWEAFRDQGSLAARLKAGPRVTVILRSTRSSEQSSRMADDHGRSL